MLAVVNLSTDVRFRSPAKPVASRQQKNPRGTVANFVSTLLPSAVLAITSTVLNTAWRHVSALAVLVVPTAQLTYGSVLADGAAFVPCVPIAPNYCAL